MVTVTVQIISYVALVHIATYACHPLVQILSGTYSHTHTHAGMAIECVIKTRMPHQYTSS